MDEPSLLDTQIIWLTVGNADFDWKSEIRDKQIEDTNRYVRVVCEKWLSEKEREVVNFRIIDKLTLREIGEKYGVSGERIRQIQSKAFRRLRHPKALGLCDPLEYPYRMHGGATFIAVGDTRN